jgi:hypothetical protein
MKRPVLVTQRIKGRRERVDPSQSLVISMAINAYPTATGGVTRQYDQNTVRLIHRSNTSLVAPEICEGKKGILNIRKRWR